MRALRVVAGEGEAGIGVVASDDGALMEGIRDGERDALGELLRRYWPKLVAYATLVLGAEDDAEDVVQDTFCSIWQHRERWISSSSVASYLYQITRNKSYNRLRKSATEHRLRSKIASITSTQAVEQSHDASLYRTVAMAVAELAPRRREVFILARVHGLTYREIAATMQISVQTVANQMTAALDQLRTAVHSKL